MPNPSPGLEEGVENLGLHPWFLTYPSGPGEPICTKNTKTCLNPIIGVKSQMIIVVGSL